MTEAIRDQNHVTVALGVSSTDSTVTLPFKIDPVTGRLLTDAAAGGYTNLTQFVDQTPWRLFYSNGSGDVTELALGAAGTILTSNGAALAPTFTAAGAGTVTSVGFTGGLISVATATTTPALTVAGTSGGIVYFSSASTWASSAALAANAIVVGGGAGVAPSTVTTGTGVLTALGINVGSAGAFVTFNGALGTPSSGTVTNLTGTASININGTVGATTPTTGVFTTLVAGSTTSLLLGTAGSAVGNIGFRNATSGTITLAPVAGALGTVTLTLPAATDTVAVLAASQAFTNKTYNGLTLTSTTGTFTLTNGKTLSVTNTLTFSGTDSTTMTFPTTSKTLAANDGSNWTFASQAIGDLVYASSTTAFTRLAAVAVGSVLSSAGTGTAPAWSSAPQITTIELGHATDTTLSRSAAGVLAVEGVVIPSISSTNTLTNKRITKRVGTTTSSATPTINTDNVDYYSLTAQTVDITSFTTNLSGTPTDNQTLWIAITGTAARAITWGASFEASTVALPTTTVTTARLDVGFVWNAATSKWRCVASA
jgi:hypothetical protein